ncbi:MAG: 7-cyano-7-deazaguanine synthase [Elusimicrobia bacterium]|nr:7-cyano-7-deazaguanine synthase [Elusimicrobiota bacterium]
MSAERVAPTERVGSAEGLAADLIGSWSPTDALGASPFSAGHISDDGASALAGYALPGGGERPDGHYVRARVDAARGELTLYREHGGGERLYFTQVGGRLHFSSSLKALLSLDGRTPPLDTEAAAERALAELVLFGDRTACAGVREVLPGHELTANAKGVSQRWACGDLLRGEEGDVKALARRLKDRLREDVARLVSDDGQAAVALSGGIDSSAIAALAVDAVGAKNVHAFTFVYDDPAHPSELPHAERVCKELGIRDHRVIKIAFDDFIATLPEAVWLAEDAAYWKRSYAVLLARAVKNAGFGTVLTGFGIGSHMSTLEEIGRALEWPLPTGLLAKHWSRRLGKVPDSADPLGRLHPGLAAPHYRLFYPIVGVLKHRGLLSDVSGLFPQGAGALAEQLLASERVAAELRGIEELPLGEALQRQAFVHMASCVDIARCEKVFRTLGVRWGGPAHFARTLPLAYFPAKTGAGGPSMRPGKLLLREAMRGVLPESIVARKKYWPHPIGSDAWRKKALERMRAASGPAIEELRGLWGSPAVDAALAHSPEGIVPLAFWKTAFLDRVASSRAPEWSELS